MPELFSQYPKYDHESFNPDRAKISPEEVDEVKTALANFAAAYADRLHYQMLKEMGKPQGHSAEHIGQITGKMLLKCIEGMPVDKQSAMIARARQLIGAEEGKANYHDTGFLPGVFGEFATGAALNKNGLTPEYPESEEDERESADLIVTLPNGKIAHIQSKTISLPPQYRRGESKSIPAPIFSSLETIEDLQAFKDSLRPQGLTDQNAIKRVFEISEAADTFFDQAQDHGFIPIMVIFHKPGDQALEAADIDPMTARPYYQAANQAKLELNLIKERYK